MRKVLASLKPYYYYLVGEGIKEIEVRKDMPKASDWNKEVLFYMSKDEKSFAKIPKEFQEKYRKHFGKVGMRVICDRVIEWKYLPDDVFPSWLRMYYISVDDGEKTCLSYREIEEYGKGKTLYGWHISDLKVYDKPKQLREFCIPCKTNCEDCKKPLFYDCWKEKGKIKVVTRPPQSYMFVEEVEQ